MSDIPFKVFAVFRIFKTHVEKFGNFSCKNTVAFRIIKLKNVAVIDVKLNKLF